ncbi:3-deoxy-D-manno-octulosonic acid transferase [Fimbriiglobus ruber]|uniref:3-deoxy-D-manno-octulosonic acid transferase n=1 Tax=Fimbriiglobus ruber TaxID=1908690 RepID=A0A225DZS8_9BACT|nr:3-deoxy-D-manno-octulosonic acid transferase [Fimbriiglobus ruber]OWK46841.1 Lipid IVA 3-deoxy-D-manno-octulosonic acid transferase [Fimbriiglobus ruber]
MFLVLDALYSFALLLLSPWLVWRAATTGRYRHGLAAKLLGRVAVSNPNGRPVAWFHGVSVGEIHLLVTLVAAFRERHPDWHVVVSSTTDTGLAEARVRFADATVIAYPFDFSWAVSAALDAIRPRIVVLAESELWPNFLAAAANRRIPVAVVNARMSPRSFARLQRVGGLARALLFRHVAAFAVQAEEYADRMRRLGVGRETVLTVTGSVKYDGAAGDRDTPKARELKRLVGLPENGADRPPVWVAGSTHAPEEAIVLDAYVKLRERFPRLRLVLVPRHPDRFAEVAQLAERTGLAVARRSRLTSPLSAMPPVVLLDTVGELGAAWALADVGYTGGSLDGKRGGQSMIEPAGYGVPTVFGPYVWNFRDAARRLVDAGGAVMVADAAGVETAVAELLADPAKRERMGAAARQLVRDQQGATGRTLDVLDRLIVSAVRTDG